MVFVCYYGLIRNQKCYPLYTDVGSERDQPQCKQDWINIGHMGFRLFVFTDLCRIWSLPVFLENMNAIWCTNVISSVNAVYCCSVTFAWIT